MRTRLLVVLTCALAACSTERGGLTLAPEHAAAIRDSVTAFLDSYAADLSNPPIGSNARAAVSRFYDDGVVMSSDLGAPDDPMLVQTLDSLVPPNEVVRQPPWIKATKLVWNLPVIRALAPGLASFTAKYAEHVTDTSGAVHVLGGVQQGIVGRGPAGWRLLSIQSAHPPATHQLHAKLQALAAPH